MPETALSESAGVTSPWLLMQTMIEKGGDPDVLKKVAELVERWEERQAKLAFSRAMNACQAEMPRVIKDADNAHTRSRYVLLETIQFAIAPVIAKHGFSLSWSQGEAPKEGLTRVVATLFHTGGHSERYQGDYPIDGTGAKGGSVMNPLQGTISAHTYAQRDMLRLMFNITIAGQDLDGAGPGIGQGEVAVINGLFDELEELADDAEGFRKFRIACLKWLNVEKLEDLPKKDFAKAVDYLTRKRQAKAATKKGGGK